MDFGTRDYETILPECGEATVISIKDSNEMGIYVSLLEFDNIEGLLLFSEISRRRVRSIAKLIKVGRKEIVSIIRVDNDKSYIDVSKRQITEIEISYMKKKRCFGKIGNLISNNIARSLSLNFEETRLRWAWQLSRKFLHLVKSFKIISKSEMFLITSIDLSVCELKFFHDNLKKKIPVSNIKIEVEIEVLCFSPNGVQVLKEVMIGTKKTSIFSDIQCKTLVSPRYSVSLSGERKKKNIRLIINFLHLISNKILSENGTLQVNKIIIT